MRTGSTAERRFVCSTGTQRLKKRGTLNRSDQRVQGERGERLTASAVRGLKILGFSCDG